jgi:hypothetical protein
MRENYQNILNIILIILLFLAGILFFTQQKAINRLSGLQSGKGAVTIPTVDTSKIDQDQKKVESTVKSVEGKALNISGNILTVEAELPDWKKMKETRDVSKNAPTRKKNYRVTVNEETKYSNNKLEAIKAGDTIGVVSKELVFQTSELTAVVIMSPSSASSP